MARRAADAADAPLPGDDEDPNGRACYASPPCFAHELDPSYLGYMDRTELLALLDGLLTSARAGARGAAVLARREPGGPSCRMLAALARQEAGHCAMLAGHIRRLGGRPGRATGALYLELLAAPDAAERLRLLDRGRAGVARRLGEALGRIGDDALHADLRALRDSHESSRPLAIS